MGYFWRKDWVSCIGQWFWTQGDCAPQRTFNNVWKHFLLLQMLLESSKQRPEKMQTVLGQDRAPQQRTTHPKRGFVLGLRNPLLVHRRCYHNGKECFLTLLFCLSTPPEWKHPGVFQFVFFIVLQSAPRKMPDTQ